MECKMVTFLTGKLFPREHDTEQLSPSCPENCQRKTHFLVLSFSRIDSSGFPLLAGVLRILNESRDRNTIAAQCITNEMLVITWRETEYRLDVCRNTNCGHTEICWAHKKLCEVQCFENVSISLIHFVVERISCFILLTLKALPPVDGTVCQLCVVHITMTFRYRFLRWRNVRGLDTVN
jgi:hypothetical protein